MVSPGEKLSFSQKLLQLTTRCAKEARDEAASARGDAPPQLVGVSIDIGDARGLYLRDHRTVETSETSAARAHPLPRALSRATPP
eukprot:1053342-Prymnesium_polylepis.2